MIYLQLDILVLRVIIQHHIMILLTSLIITSPPDWVYMCARIMILGSFIYKIIFLDILIFPPSIILVMVLVQIWKSAADYCCTSFFACPAFTTSFLHRKVTLEQTWRIDHPNYTSTHHTYVTASVKKQTIASTILSTTLNGSTPAFVQEECWILNILLSTCSRPQPQPKRGGKTWEYTTPAQRVSWNFALESADQCTKLTQPIFYHVQKFSIHSLRTELYFSASEGVAVILFIRFFNFML
jgi:hypothetical protein